MKYRIATKAPMLWLVTTDLKQEYLLDREPEFKPCPTENIVVWRNIGADEWNPGDAFRRYFNFIHKRAET